MFISSRAKAAAVVTGAPPTTRSHSSRASAGVALNGTIPQPSAQGSRATQARAHNSTSATRNLGASRTIAQHNHEIGKLVGQLIHLPDGRAVRILGLDVILPETEHNYSSARSYGCAADATAVARLRPIVRTRPSNVLTPLDKPSHAVAADATTVAGRRLPNSPLQHRSPLPQQRPSLAVVADATAIARPFDPRDIHPLLPPPLQTRQQQAAAKFGGIEKHYNGPGALLEGYGLINKSITPVNNSAFQMAQRINRLAGKKIIIPSHLASRSAALVRAVAPGRAVALTSKFGKVAGPLGMGLTLMNIGIEVETGAWDAHTVVNGVLLVVTAAGLVLAGTAAAPVLAVAGAVIAVYGILDYSFDIGQTYIDPAIGRKSHLWD